MNEVPAPTGKGERRLGSRDALMGVHPKVPIRLERRGSRCNRDDRFPNPLLNQPTQSAAPVIKEALERRGRVSV